ncbi:MAG: SH3 domain-containing protein [Clostridiales bacterium]|nr:SH3 domain-containing protein [Clostridiales bacterium]
MAGILGLYDCVTSADGQGGHRNMLDNIREWISDNLRYILLGLAVILLIIIAFFAIRLVTHIGSGSSKNNTTVQETETQTEDADSSNETVEALVKDQEDVLSLAKTYWTAVGDLDFDTLEQICGTTFDETARATVEATDKAVESYDDIITYSKNGVTDGSYVVYVYMEMKLNGIETEAPTLRQMYMQPDSDGTLLVLPSENYTTEITDYILERQTDADVQALINDVNNTLTERCVADEDLAKYIESISSGTDSTDSSSEDGDSAGGSDSEATLGTMQTTTGVNVRSEASAESTKLGSLVAGSQVEVLENLDDGWSRITYIDSSGSTVEGYVMTQYLTE